MPVLQRIWNHWKHFGRWMGDQVARAVFSAFYFTIALPFGLIARLGSHALDTKSSPSWLPKASSEISIDTARRLF